MPSMSSLDGRFAVIWGFPLFFICDEGFCVVGFEIWETWLLLNLLHGSFADTCSLLFLLVLDTLALRTGIVFNVDIARHSQIYRL